MSQQELLKRVVQILTGSGIDYMVTGSVASSLQGEPRSTHDIDLVIESWPQVRPHAGPGVSAAGLLSLRGSHPGGLAATDDVQPPFLEPTGRKSISGF